MKTTKRRPKRDCRSDAGNRNELQIREVRRKEEVAEFDELLNQEHYIGQARPAGDFLRQEALLDGEGVGGCWPGVRPATRSKTGMSEPGGP